MISKEYTESLKETVAAFNDRGNQFTFQNVLSKLFEGIRENCSISVAYDVDYETRDGHIYFHEYDDGSETAFVFTDEDDLNDKGTLGLTLRAIVKEMKRNDACDGMLINPGEDDVFISKELLLTALDAGSVLAREEIEQEARLFASQDKEHELICRRPLSAQSFEEIKERIEDFDINTDDFLKISFLNEEDTLFAQVLRSEDGRHLSFGMDMSAWSWDEPLVLGKSMPTGDAIQLLRRVCVYCEDPSSMKEVESFKRM